MEIDMEVLRSVSCLKEVPESDLTDLAGLLHLREVGRQEKIVEEGKPIDAFYIVFCGNVHVRRATQKSDVLLGRIGKGGFFGEINLFDPDPGMATANVLAMDVSVVGSISYREFRVFMSSHPKAGYAIVSSLMSEVCHRLRTTNDRLVNFVYWSSLNESPGIV